MTMRTRRMGSPIADTGRCIRYTTLTCLVCQTLTYRVQQLVPLDVDGQEGPLLPSLDWVEHETLKSLHGWIEVHNSCLVSPPLRTAHSQSSSAAPRLPSAALTWLPSIRCLASRFISKSPYSLQYIQTRLPMPLLASRRPRLTLQFSTLLCPTSRRQFPLPPLIAHPRNSRTSRNTTPQPGRSCLI